MKLLSKKHKEIFKHLDNLVKDLEEGDGVKIEIDGYMPLWVEKNWNIENADYTISMSHTFIQNGDVMNDPEVCILKTSDGEFGAISYKLDPMAIFQESVLFDEKGLKGVYPRLQRQHGMFLQDWLKNLKGQGFIGEALFLKKDKKTI